MMDERRASAKKIFDSAVDLSPSERDRFLSQQCRHDPALRALVERLLKHHEDGIGVFIEPAQSDPPMNDEPSITIPKHIGPYEIIRKLGEGGMGTVYLARQEKPHRTVALKVMRLPAADTVTLKRFDFEIEVLGQLNHPGIAQIFEAGTGQDGTPFFAMEYVQGRPLLEHTQSRGLGTRDRLALFARACDAVHYAHERGVLHRDLKPGNIMVSETEGQSPQPKILDFGVARAIGTRIGPDSLHTRTGTLVGTLAYMSPEQVAGRPEELDVRSDLYQLGIIIFELLTGRLPYEVEGLSVTEAMRVIREEDPPKLASFDAHLRGDITTIVGKALEKDPRRRFTTVADLAEDVRRHLDGKPIRARPPSATYRIGKLIQRRAGLVGSAGVGLALVAALLSLLWWNGRDLTRPEEIRATRIVAEDFGATDLYLAVSPDGQTVAYTEGADVNLGVVGTGEVKTILPNEEGRSFQWIEWHPDNERLLTEEWRDDKYETWLTSVRTGNREPVRESSERSYPVVSPGSRRLAYLTNNSRELRIGTFDGGNGSPIVQVAETEFISPPAWAPDGNHIAYTVTRQPDWRGTLEITDLEGNRSRLVENAQNNDSGSGPARLSWLPDGRLIYSRFVSELDRELVALKVDLESGEIKGAPRRFFGMEGTRLILPSASADGQRIVFARDIWDRRLMLLDIGSEPTDTDLHQICITDWAARPGVWSVEGRRIFFETERKAGDWDIYVRDLDQEREEPFVVSPRSESPQSLTPDGSHLLYLQDRDLMSIPVSGGEPRHLLRVAGEAVIVGVRCAGGTDTVCVIVENEGSELVVRPFSLDGELGPETLRVGVDLEGGIYSAFDLSPNGSQLAITEWSGRIRVIDLPTGETRELENRWGGGIMSVHWSRNGASLYLSGMKGVAAYWIVRLDLEGEFEILWESADTWANNPVPSPDDRSIVFQTIRFWGDIWMLEGF